MVIRRQASLYLTNVPHIETMRDKFNPTQARLIPAHVTLCREDEVTDWDDLSARLQSLEPVMLCLEFGAPVREDNFVHLPICRGLEQFHELRRALLPVEPRLQTPHLTIMHPRNSICTDAIFAEISKSISPFQYTFRKVMLIQQEDGGKWNRIIVRANEC